MPMKHAEDVSIIPPDNSPATIAQRLKEQEERLFQEEADAEDAMAEAAMVAAPPPVAKPAGARVITVPRSVYVIQAELTAARAKFTELQEIDSRYHGRRKRTLARFEKWQKDWPLANDDPWEDDDIPDNCRVPPESSPVGVEFWALHYTIDELTKELEAAKKAATGR